MFNYRKEDMSVVVDSNGKYDAYFTSNKGKEVVIKDGKIIKNTFVD